jgi:hypothetical protein
MSAEHFETFNEENVAKKSHRSGRRKYYPSNKSQSLIVNAVTGEKYPYKVGSFDQTRLYKIVDSSGTCDGEGYIITSRKEPTNPTPNHLFFESPEECMKLMRIDISPENVKGWRAKVRERFTDYSAPEYYGAEYDINN